MRPRGVITLLAALVSSSGLAQYNDRVPLLMEEIARNLQFVPVEPSCKGQARPLYGTVRQQFAYTTPSPVETVRRALDSGDVAQLGLLPVARWKWLLTVQARSYRADANDNVYFTFSLRPKVSDHTSVCVLLWDVPASKR